MNPLLKFTIRKDYFSVETPNLNNNTILMNVLTTIFSDFKPSEDKDFKAHLDEAWGEYQMWWSKSGDKDFELLWAEIKDVVGKEDFKKALDKTYKFLRKHYQIAINTAKGMLDKEEIVYKSVEEKHKVYLQDGRKTINERIRFAFSKEYKAADVAAVMGVKSVRVSSVYTKLKKLPTA